MTKRIELENMSSPEISRAIKSGMDSIVFGIGSIEQHGPCLPVLTDSAIADKLAFLVAHELDNALKGPTLMFGCSDPHMNFPGTISLRKETLQNLIIDYCASLANHGFKRIIILPTHGGNFEPLAEIVGNLKAINPDVQIIAYTDIHEYVDILQDLSEELGISKEESGAHAGEFEVSQMLWAREDLVDTGKIPESAGYMGEFTENETRVIWEKGIEGLSSIGVLGSAVRASREHGEKYFEKLVSFLIEFISKS